MEVNPLKVKLQVTNFDVHLSSGLKPLRADKQSANQSRSLNSLNLEPLCSRTPAKSQEKCLEAWQTANKIDSTFTSKRVDIPY
jgi:hypothetical protein